jgi:hypothetical protein
MRLKENNKIAILRYKLLFEELSHIKNELSIGSADFLYHLNHFRKKLNSSKNSASQVKKFDHIFFKKQEFQNNITISNSVPGDDKKSKDVNDESIPKWAKKLYKKIVAVTHPDKTRSIPSSHLIEKLTKQYLVTTVAYENKEYCDLLMIGYDLGFDVPEKQIENLIVPKLHGLDRNIKNQKSNVGYQWYHIAEDIKEIFLEDFLSKMGFDFTKEKIVEVIIKVREKNKRKPGTRPVNIRKKA